MSIVMRHFSFDDLCNCSEHSMSALHTYVITMQLIIIQGICVPHRTRHIKKNPEHDCVLVACAAVLWAGYN